MPTIGRARQNSRSLYNNAINAGNLYNVVTPAESEDERRTRELLAHARPASDPVMGNFEVGAPADTVYSALLTARSSQPEAELYQGEEEEVYQSHGADGQRHRAGVFNSTSGSAVAPAMPFAAPALPASAPNAWRASRAPSQSAALTPAMAHDQLRQRMPMIGHQTEQQRGVKYYSDAERRRIKFAVEVGAKLKRRGVLLDSPSVVRYYTQGTPSGKKWEVGSQNLGVNRTGERFYMDDVWVRGPMIWVLAPDESGKPTFYSHVGKKGRFHHSSFLNGGDVMGAGEWVVEEGRLVTISANSGHYQPTLSFLHRSVLLLAAAFDSSTTVYLYDSRDDQWVYRPVRDFIRRPSDSGRYWAHQRSGNGQWVP